MKNARLLLLALVTILSVGLVGSGLRADDRDLLRLNEGDPYLFILLDSSSSMALDFQNNWVHAGSDDPRSKIYAAKEALYLTVKDLPGIHYGFAHFNQDNLRIVGKHWLYYILPGSADSSGVSNSAKLDQIQQFFEAGGAALPEARWPLEEVDGQVEVPELDSNGDPTGFYDVEIASDMMTFGPPLIPDVPGGTCGTPLDVATEREKINRYPKLGLPNTPTSTPMYISLGGETYLTTWTISSGQLADAQISVQLQIQQMDINSLGVCLPVPGSDISKTLTLTLWRPFFLQDDATSDPDGSVDIGRGGCGAGRDAEDSVGGWWETSDVEGTFACGTTKPHSGDGWEGNYDTGPPFWTDGGVVESDPLNNRPANPAVAAALDDTDCAPNQTDLGAGCKLLLQGTNYSSATILDRDGNFPSNPGGLQDTRELDWGDTLSWNFNVDFKDEFLARLNPNHLVDQADFGAASFYNDEPDGADPANRYSLVTGDKPVVAAGISPIGSAVLDFRCWALGNFENKCRNDATGLYDSGWINLFQDEAPNFARCRVPFLIIITDGYSNCEGSSKVSEVAGMNNASDIGGAEGISTWVFDVGPRINGQTCDAVANAGKGEVIQVSSRSVLRDKLKEIIGLLLEDQRTFAAAAVPSVQADVGDSIYFTKFRPLQDEPVWPGQALAFPKPIPLDLDEDPPVPADGAELWDASYVLSSTQAPEAADVGDVTDGPGYDRTELRIGFGLNPETRRRVFYSTLYDGSGMAAKPSQVDRRPMFRNLFGPAVEAPSGLDENDVREDLWSGMNQISSPFFWTNTADPADPALLFAQHQIVAERAHNTFKRTYSIKNKTFTDSDGNTENISWVMGDVFHSNPLLLDSPQNSRYVANEEDFPGYRQFATLHERRRKVLLFGSNDGQFHAFDAGTFELDISNPIESVFNDGTGTEIFAYIPRTQLPTVSDRAAPGASSHQWGVDGTVIGSDVRIDPCHNAAGTSCSGAPDPDDRQWRTVVAFGLRRGGKSYTVLDMTHPDRMTTFGITTSTGATIDEGYRPVDNDPVPSCLEAQDDGIGLVKNNGCNTPDIDDELGNPHKMASVIPYGTALFEFTDGADDDGNGKVDLGQTWSIPDIGAVRVCVDTSDCADPANVELRFVMIFGGGLPDAGTVTNPMTAVSGNWLYMVDIETGKTIYKRPLEGAAPAPPAALDIDGDGVLDRVYQGTLAGNMYRVDLTEPGELDPCTTRPSLSGSDCIEANWDPVVLFDAGERPIFFRPSVVFLADLGRYGLAFGTGDRNQLWAAAPIGGNRLYTFADEVCQVGSISGTCLDPSTDLPLTEADLVDVTGAVLGDRDGLLNDPSVRGVGERGWYMRFGLPQSNDGDIGNGIIVRPEDELLVTPPFVVSGVLVFSTFLPNIGCDPTVDPGCEVRCARRGTSRNYVALVTNGEPLRDNISTPSETLVTEPFIQPTSTDRGGEDSDPDDDVDPCDPDEVAQISQVLERVVFDPTCKFSPTLGFDMMLSNSKLGIECLARVPLCIRDFGWKDF